MINSLLRQQFRQVQAHKAARRQQLASDVSILWESNLTVDHQIETMALLEPEDALEAVTASYEQLRPTETRVTATVSIEVTDQTMIKQRLQAYRGIEHCFTLQFRSTTIPARIIADYGTSEAATAIIYLAFEVPEYFASNEASLCVDHPELQVEVPLPI